MVQPPGSYPRAMADEGVLFEGLRLGSTQAFEELLRAEGPTMQRLSRLYVPEEASPRLVRQAWAVALPGLDMFTWHTTLRAWLTGILVTYGRAARLSPAAPAPTHPPAPSTPSTPVAAPTGRTPATPATPVPWATLRWSSRWTADSWVAFEGALAALPLPEREVLWLRDVEGWSWREVLDTLGLTAEQGDLLLHRGRSSLLGSIARWLGAAPVDPTGQEPLDGVVALLGGLHPAAEETAPDPQLLRMFTAWRRRRGVRAWRRWRWELDRAGALRRAGRLRVRPGTR